MTILTEPTRQITVGVDTHRDTNVAAVLDDIGRVLDTASFATTSKGYQQLLEWANQFGSVDAAGVEGTGSWGTGFARHANQAGVRCVEVNRPNRQHRRRHGKSDTADAVAAAKAVLSGEADAVPRGHDAEVECLRVVRVAHRSAVKARTQGLNQVRSLISTCPEVLREQLRPLGRRVLIETCARFRPGLGDGDPVVVTKFALRSVARRVQFLDEEIGVLEERRVVLVDLVAPPALMAEMGVGYSVAADLLIAFGDNPERVRSEGSFAALCGVSPVDASSGRQQRHRLNRGGDRQANNALWRVVLVRLAHDERTREYMVKARSGGKSKREVVRCLKRYVARRVWKIMVDFGGGVD